MFSRSLRDSCFVLLSVLSALSFDVQDVQDVQALSHYCFSSPPSAISGNQSFILQLRLSTRSRRMSNPSVLDKLSAMLQNIVQGNVLQSSKPQTGVASLDPGANTGFSDGYNPSNDPLFHHSDN